MHFPIGFVKNSQETCCSANSPNAEKGRERKKAAVDDPRGLMPETV